MSDLLLRLPWTEIHSNAQVTYTPQREVTLVTDGELHWVGWVLAEWTYSWRDPLVDHYLWCTCNDLRNADPEPLVHRSTYDPHYCKWRKAANRYRQVEVVRELGLDDNQDYLRISEGMSWDLIKATHIREIYDLARAGTWVGQDDSALYLQHCAVIMDEFIGNMWEYADEGIRQRWFSLNGAILTPYRDPPEPRWTLLENYTVDPEGWLVECWMPVNQDRACFGKVVMYQDAEHKAADKPLFRPDRRVRIYHDMGGGFEQGAEDSLREGAQAMVAQLRAHHQDETHYHGTFTVTID